MPNATTTPWTPTIIARLREMHANGDSFGVIASELNLTRSMIAGKCKRLGLRFAAPVQRRSFAPIAKTRRPKPQPVTPLSLPFGALRRTTCHFPEGDRGNFTFCGHETSGETYCPYHMRVAYRRAA